MIELMERNRRAIQHEIGMLAFYMQGGITYDQAHLLSAEQRRSMSKIIEKHYEAVNGKEGGKLIG